MSTFSRPRPRAAGGARSPLATALAIALAIVLPFTVATRAAAAGESRWQGGANLIVAATRGDLSDVFGTGVGVEPFGVFRLDRAGVLGVRVQGGMIDYGNEVRSVPLVGGGPSIGVQISTKRSATTLAVGPQLSWQRGRLHPYVFATAAAAFFNSQADLSGRDSSGIYRVLSADLNRTVVGAGAGGGLGFRVTQTVHLDAGVEYRRYHDVRTIGNGAAELPTGEVFMRADRGDLGMIISRIGVTVSLPASGGRPGPRRSRRGG